MSLCFISGNICFTERGFQQQVKLPVSTSVLWRRLSPTWASARAMAVTFLGKRFCADATLPLHSSQTSETSIFSSFSPPPLSSSSSVKSVLLAPPDLSAASSYVPEVISAAAVAAAWQASLVSTILAGILTHVQPASVPQISLSVLSHITITAIASFVLVLFMISSPALVLSTSGRVLSAPTAGRQSSPEAVLVNR